MDIETDKGDAIALGPISAETYQVSLHISFSVEDTENLQESFFVSEEILQMQIKFRFCDQKKYPLEEDRASQRQIVTYTILLTSWYLNSVEIILEAKKIIGMNVYHWVRIFFFHF